MQGKLKRKEDGKWVVEFKMFPDFTIQEMLVKEEQQFYPEMFKDKNGGYFMDGMDIDFTLVRHKQRWLDKDTPAPIVYEVNLETKPVISDDFQIGPDGAYEDKYQIHIEELAEKEYLKFNPEDDVAVFFHFKDSDIWKNGWAHCYENFKFESPGDAFKLIMKSGFDTEQLKYLMKCLRTQL